MFQKIEFRVAPMKIVKKLSHEHIPSNGERMSEQRAAAAGTAEVNLVEVRNLPKYGGYTASILYRLLQVTSLLQASDCLHLALSSGWPTNDE
jgi:hypothetical protein